MRLPPFNPRLAVAIAIFAASTTAIFVNLAGDIPASIIAHYHFLGALLIMIPIVFIKYSKELRSIRTSDWIMLILNGVVLAIHFNLWFGAFQQNSVMSIVFIISLHPVLLIIANAFIFKERFSLGTLISIFIALFGGSILLTGDFNRSSLLFKGDLLAIGALFTLVVYYMLGQRARQRLSLFTHLTIVYSVAFITLLAYNISNDINLISYGPKQWLLFGLLAIVPTFLGVYLFNWSLRWLRASTISLGMLFQPIVATVLAYFILNENVTPTQWVGGTILFFGLYLFIISTSRKKKVTISKRE